MSDRYRDVTSEELERLDQQCLLTQSGGGLQTGEIYVSKPLTPEKIKQTVAAFLSKFELLFLPSEFVMLTEPITGLTEMDEVRKSCEEVGYRVTEIEPFRKQGKYLGSDHGGHYSTDYYEYTNFCRVTINPQ